MSNTLVAQRYAKALFDLAQQSGTVEAIDADVEMIDETMRGSRELVNLFQSPIISRKKKENVTEELFGSRVQRTTIKFLSMLIAKGREDIFPEIVESYRDLRDEQLGIVRATARTASPLSEDDEKNLRMSLERLTGKRIRIQTVVDKSLLGGVSVQVGDTVYDGSVKHQLEDLRETFRLHPSTHN